MRKLVATMAVFFTLALPALVLAQGFDADSSGLTTTGTQVYGVQSEESLNAGMFIGIYIIKPIIGLTGLAFLVLTVFAGVMWMTSAGNEKQVAKAKNILVAAVTGAVIVASAYAITNTVISSLSTTTAPAATQADGG
jgi:hypothetical protein